MQFERTIAIACPPTTLWELLTNPEQVPRWAPEVVGIERLTPEPHTVGARSRLTIREGGQDVLYEEQVMVLEPESCLEIELREGSLGASPMRVRYALSPTEQGSSLHYTCDWKPVGLKLWLLLPLIALMGRRNASQSLGRLKELAESSALAER